MTDTTTLNAFILPSQHRPGTDLVSKLILCHPSVRNIIVNAVLDFEACPQYVDRSTEWPIGRCLDVLYAPIEVTISLSPVLPSILATIQNQQLQKTQQTIQHLTQTTQQSNNDSIPLDGILPGGRLYHFIQYWKKVTIQSWPISVVETDYRLQFDRMPTPWRTKPLRMNIEDQLAVDLAL
ncbi:hypothetical protein G6F37_003293 [Rhizopus arrhizus]|nr:hypothetical protein G6F38_006858 [Rhizopus arrhizus]KAG1161196.1 hypothetical protein G6F37_003293 [Rhizopus arrhizus]